MKPIKTNNHDWIFEIKWYRHFGNYRWTWSASTFYEYEHDISFSPIASTSEENEMMSFSLLWGKQEAHVDFCEVSKKRNPWNVFMKYTHGSSCTKEGTWHCNNQSCEKRHTLRIQQLTQFIQYQCYYRKRAKMCIFQPSPFIINVCGLRDMVMQL